MGGGAHPTLNPENDGALDCVCVATPSSITYYDYGYPIGKRESKKKKNYLTEEEETGRGPESDGSSIERAAAAFFAGARAEKKSESHGKNRLAKKYEYMHRIKKLLPWICGFSFFDEFTRG